MSAPFTVLTPAQAKRVAKAIAKAKNALDLISILIVASGVENMVKSLRKRKISKPRKAKAPKAGKPAEKAGKPTDPLTA